jgi:hypothetical protein
MKWLTYFSTGATILLIGYWLGTSHQQPQQKPEQKSEVSIPAET